MNTIRPTSTDDRLTIRGITFRAPCGVWPEERTLGVALTVDVTLYLDLSPAARADALEQTVDYGTLSARVVALAEGTERLLIERLAEEIADDLLSTYPVSQVNITVHKPHPPVPHISGGVSVTIRRTNAPNG